MLFGKKKPTPTFAPNDTVKRVTTVLGPGINWKGDLRGKGGVRIEGALEGEIAVRGMVIIGETGRVTGKTIKADTIIVAGTVNGQIISEKLEIRATGRVYGDVTAQSFSTDEGAFLRGKITMEDAVDLSDLPQPLEPEPEEEKVENDEEGED
ncbi:MAG: polymer-forming cytoskeletal protein [Chloroflexota bacterium]|jgi:cytoskeletal protein CcmA (bactofilin family)|nr:polymer-forming cytoskeletal protein [Chloroflexota bacterium]